MSPDGRRPTSWDSPFLHSSRAPAVRAVCSWLDSRVAEYPFMIPMRDLMQSALDGRPIDVSRTDWATMTPEHIEADGTLAGCMSRHCRQWREIAPDRTDLWMMLRNGWADCKVDPDCPYAKTSAAIPSRSLGQAAIEVQYPKMLEMGVISLVEDPPATFSPTGSMSFATPPRRSGTSTAIFSTRSGW